MKLRKSSLHSLGNTIKFRIPQSSLLSFHYPIQSQIELINKQHQSSHHTLFTLPLLIHSFIISNDAGFQDPIQRLLCQVHPLPPFHEDRFAIAIAQNFRILANGHLHVLALSPNPSQPFTELTAYGTADGIYDLAWSESHDSLIIAAVTDGTVKLCDIALPPSSNPIRPLCEHTREVHSADYNPLHGDSFLTPSWDDTVKHSWLLLG